MAEQERLTKKERRELARQERKVKEAEAAKKARRQRLTTILVSTLVIAGVAAIVAQAFLGGDDLGEAITVEAAAYEDARSTAGCEVVSDQPLAERSHLDPASAPPADVLYAGAPRPTHSGSHFSATHPIDRDGLESQGEERQLTHNLEHGAVILWYDPEQVDDATVTAMQDWAEQLNDAGFAIPRGAGAVFVSPYTEPGISSGKAIALRAWGYAVDCDAWDETVGNGFVIERFGTHGPAPENFLSPYPEGVLEFSDREVEDAPQGGGHTPTEGEPTESGTTEPSTTETDQ